MLASSATHCRQTDTRRKEAASSAIAAEHMKPIPASSSNRRGDGRCSALQIWLGYGWELQSCALCALHTAACTRQQQRAAATKQPKPEMHGTHHLRTTTPANKREPADCGHVQQQTRPAAPQTGRQCDISAGLHQYKHPPAHQRQQHACCKERQPPHQATRSARTCDIILLPLQSIFQVHRALKDAHATGKQSTPACSAPARLLLCRTKAFKTASIIALFARGTVAGNHLRSRGQASSGAAGCCVVPYTLYTQRATWRT